MDLAPSRTLPILGLGLGLVLLAGCATVRAPAEKPLLPTQSQTRVGPYVVFTSEPIPSDAPALKHLASLEKQVETTLGLRVPEGEAPIEVYVLDGPEEFRHFLMFYFPELPTRRAFFLAQGNRRVVYTYQGGRLEEDLRHEATHALLHAAAADLPLWLDEGLAEYFEVEEGKAGLNAEHIARLPDDLASGWVPALPRLEAMKDVRRMGPRDYRESWAWVHFLLNGSPEGKTALLAYLNDLRHGGDVSPLSKRLAASLEDPVPGLVAHISRARDQPPTVRLQGPETVTPRPPAKRRGLFQRWFGGENGDRSTVAPKN